MIVKCIRFRTTIISFLKDVYKIYRDSFHNVGNVKL